jgi:DNA-binding MarR family transcriptional regulator
MSSDLIDVVLKQWGAERPDLNPRPLAVVGRILRVAGILERRANQSLRSMRLPIWAFDMLGALYRKGAPYSMTPTELIKSTVLTSGAMTNRIDRLEKQGFVARMPATVDRRSLKVSLTPTGLSMIEKAAPVRFLEAADAVNGLSVQEQKQLAGLLRTLLSSIEPGAK